MNQRFFWIGCGLEAGLSVVAVGLNALFGQPLFNDLRWDNRHALFGLIATVPALALFLLTLRSREGPLARLGQYLEHTVRPLFHGWSLWQLLLISALAGLGEELLFRGAIQGTLTRWLGLLPGLVLASVIFGAFHPMTTTYLIITTLMGAYLGTLWIVTNNLLCPVVTHALYDFAALVYLLRRTR